MYNHGHNLFCKGMSLMQVTSVDMQWNQTLLTDSYETTRYFIVVSHHYVNLLTHTKQRSTGFFYIIRQIPLQFRILLDDPRGTCFANYCRTMLSRKRGKGIH